MSHFKRITVTALIMFGLATSSQVYAEPAASPPAAGISTPAAGMGPTVPPDLPPSVSDAGAPVSPIDMIPATDLEKIEQTLRTWQVCTWLGQTYQQMALETDQLVRESVYHSTEISTPFSEPTINELLDRREEVDAFHYQRMSGPGVIAGLPPVVIDLTGTTSVSPAGDYVILDVVSVDEYSGEQHLNARGSMAFRLVDGVWLVDWNGQLP